MKILSVNPSLNRKNSLKQQDNSTFLGRGKPISLQYIVEKRGYLLPERVLEEAEKIVKQTSTDQPSLKDLHKTIYTPLLTCNTLDEAKKLFPEFSNIGDKVEFQRDSVYSQRFTERVSDNFVLETLKDFWANLKTKTQIAKEHNMPNRTSLQWALDQVGFVSFSSNYRTLINSSDEQGNALIASKTTAWNQLHPDLMYKKNKHAAQSCKTDKYRAEQSERIKEYDKMHPERRQKISEADKRTWELCPEVKDAMALFSMGENQFVRGVVMKKAKGIELTSYEKRVAKAFYKHFWDSHPEMKEIYARAKQQAKREREAIKK